MSGDTLRRAASQGQAEYLKKLLAAGSNPCSVDEIGATALHHAVWNGHEDAVKVLLINDRGTNDSGARAWALQQQTNAGWSALHVSAVEGLNAPDVIKLLLFAGVDQTLRDVDGRTAEELAWAAAAETGSAVRELCAVILRDWRPEDEVVDAKRAEIKAEHWVQEVRRDNRAFISDFKAPHRDRAPVLPPPLQIPEEYHEQVRAEGRAEGRHYVPPMLVATLRTSAYASEHASTTAQMLTDGSKPFATSSLAERTCRPCAARTALTQSAT